MKRRVLIITSEDLLRPAEPVSGGALRVHGLAEGLRRWGHDVVVSIPRDALRDGDPEAVARHAHVPEEMAKTVFDAMPDIILVEQWGLATFLPESEIPVVLDLHGPLSLENAFKEKGNFRSDALTKIDALARADLLCVPGKAQKHYFLSWFLFSGADPKTPPIIRAPLSMDDAAPKRAKNPDRALVFAGSTWPWIDPFPALQIAAREAEGIEGSRVDLYVGAPKLSSTHPLYDINRGVFADYETRLKSSSAARFHGLISREALLGVYAKSRAALDIYQPNPERELAYSTRTVEYLWAGLPVITCEAMELADEVARFDAGWVVAHDDEAGIAAAVREALTSDDAVRRKSEGAKRLAAERFDHKHATTDLARWIARPKRRTKSATLVSDIRDYYRQDAARFVSEAREAVTRVNESMRDAAVEHQKLLAEKEQRYDALVRDLRQKEDQYQDRLREQAEKHETRFEEARREIRSLQDEVKDLARKNVETADALRRDLTDRYEREIAELRTAQRDEIRDTQERHRLEVERYERRAAQIEEELRRVNLDRETLTREHAEEIKALSRRYEDQAVEAGRQSAREIERRDTEIDALRKKIDDARAELSQEIKRLNLEAQEAARRHDDEIKALIARHEDERRDAAKHAQEELARRERHLESARERFEIARELLENRIKEMDAERVRLAESYDERLREAKTTEERITRMLRDAQDEALAGDRRAKDLAEVEGKLREELERAQKELVARDEAIDELKTRLEDGALAHEAVRKEYEDRLDAEKALREQLATRIDDLTAEHEHALADLSGRLDVEIAAKDEAVNAYNHKLKELEAADERIREYQGRLDQLLKDFEARFQELDRIITDREHDVLVARERFEQLEGRMGEQAGVISQLERELGQTQSDLRRTANDLNATVAQFRLTQEDLAKTTRHATDLAGELTTLRHRNTLAERILTDMRANEALKASTKRRYRLEKFFVRLPKLGVLWVVNLLTNLYMESWQKKRGVQIFPGMKKATAGPRPR